MKLDILINKTTDELKRKRGAICQKCSGHGGLEVDHIIPVSWLISFGIKKNDAYKRLDLLQLLCRRCNILKADRLDWNNPKTKEILLKLIHDI